MKLPVKYIILLFAFIAGFASFAKNNIGAGMAAGGAFVAYAALEIYDLIIINRTDETED